MNIPPSGLAVLDPEGVDGNPFSPRTSSKEPSRGQLVEVEPATREPAQRRARLVRPHLGRLRVRSAQDVQRVLLALLLLEVLLLGLAQLLGHSADLVLVLARLRVQHRELRAHLLRLPPPLLQRVLVERELLRHLRPRLSREDVLELEVELLLVVYEQLLVDHLLALLDEPPLQHVDLLHELVRRRVGALELAPPVHVDRVLELLRQCAHLGPLLQQLALQLVDLVAKRLEVGRRAEQALQLARLLLDEGLEQPQLLEPLRVLRPPLVERALLDADALVDERELLVAPHELRAQDVALVAEDAALLLLPLALLVGLVDDGVELGDLARELADQLVVLPAERLELRVVVLEVVLLLLDLHVVEVLLDEALVLLADLVLELLDLLVHDLEAPLHLGNLVLRLDEVLRVEVAVGAHRLVQRLLLLQFRLAVGDALLQLDDRELADLDLLERLRVLRARLARLGAVLLALLLEQENDLALRVRVALVPGDLLLEILARVLVDLDQVDLLRVADARLLTGEEEGAR
eukprot:scaffold86114_cov74-Phaeocystis_antarctica.AAC.1